MKATPASATSASMSASVTAPVSAAPAAADRAPPTSAGSPAPATSLTFSRGASDAPAAALVAHIVEMLGRSAGRTQALIQTLGAHGTTGLLAHALRAAPDLVSADLLHQLATHGARAAFEAAVELRPDAADSGLVLRLCEGDSRPVFLATVLRLRPDLKATVSEDGQSLADILSRNTRADPRLVGLKLEIVVA